MWQTRIIRQTAAAIALPLLLVSAAHGRNYHRGNYYAAARQRMINSAQAQIAAARQAQSMAQAQMSQAQAKVDSSNARIRAAKSEMDSGKSDEHNLHLTLQEIQERLIQETGSDSNISKAHGALINAIAEYDEASKRVLNSDDYKEKAAAITDHVERLKKLPEIREAAFAADEDYQNKLERLHLEKVKFGQLRTEMVRGSDEWMAMSQQVRDAIKAQNHAEIEATNGGSAKMRAKYRLHDAQAVFAAATMTIAQNENILRRLGVQPPKPPASSPSASAGS